MSYFNIPIDVVVVVVVVAAAGKFCPVCIPWVVVSAKRRSNADN